MPATSRSAAANAQTRSNPHLPPHSRPMRKAARNQQKVPNAMFFARHRSSCARGWRGHHSKANDTIVNNCIFVHVSVAILLLASDATSKLLCGRQCAEEVNRRSHFHSKTVKKAPRDQQKCEKPLFSVEHRSLCAEGWSGDHPKEHGRIVNRSTFTHLSVTGLCIG